MIRLILKKPYATLIKNFRIIHIVLAILLGLIAYFSHDILGLFRDFVNNGYSISVVDNMVSRYISPILYIAIIASIIILIAIYILLKYKNKPSKVYLFAIIYYIIMLIFVIIAASLISGLTDSLWSTTAARTYRDICSLIYYPQFIFVIMITLRALGFNVKKFNFKADLQDMEISAEDSEDIEVNINFQTYKFERTLRRLAREFGYYFKENKFLIFVIAIIIVVITVIVFIRNYDKTDYMYNENQSFSYDGFTLNILESSVSNLDYNGNIIYNDKYFVIIKLSIVNNTTADKTLNYDNLKLYYGDEYVYPSLDLGNYFIDFGTPFMGNAIKAKNSGTYVLCYMIDEKYKNSDFKINIYLNSVANKKEFMAKTITVNLKPSLTDKVSVARTVNAGSGISISSTALGDASLVVANPIFATRYEYTYENCFKDSCRTYKDYVVAGTSNKNKQALLIFDYDLTLDETSPSYQSINSINSFASAFMQVEYINQEKSTISSTKNVTPQKLNDKIVLQVDEDVLNAEEVNLLITIRNRRYIIKLK